MDAHRPGASLPLRPRAEALPAWLVRRLLPLHAGAELPARADHRGPHPLDGRPERALAPALGLRLASVGTARPLLRHPRFVHLLVPSPPAPVAAALAHA